MSDEILFYEKQPFWRNWLMIGALITVSVIFIWGFIQQIILGITWGNNPMSDVGLIIASSLILLFNICLAFTKMQTVITEEGIYLRYLPFDLHTRFFAWDDMKEAYIRKYSPLREFGGWGVRFNFTFSGGRAYNIYGSKGLQLVFDNGKKVLIGTNRADELAEVLKKINGKRNQK
jgi:hypothetical protein